MIIAVLADIHSNYQAFQACLQYAEQKQADHYLLLGDYISGCPYPERTLDLLYELIRTHPCTLIRGNREEYMLSYRDGKEHPWTYSSGTGNLLYTYEQLRPADFAFFESLSNQAEVSLPDAPKMYLCHGTPERSRGSLAEHKPETPGLLEKIDAPVVLCGHTHSPYAYQRWGKTVINPGSVGLNFGSEGKKARMAMLETSAGSFRYELVSLDYDWEQTIRDFRESGLDEKAKVWAAMDRHVLLTGERKTYDLPFLVHRLWLEDGFEDGVWREIPEKYWEIAAKQMGVM